LYLSEIDFTKVGGSAAEAFDSCQKEGVAYYCAMSRVRPEYFGSDASDHSAGADVVVREEPDEEEEEEDQEDNDNEEGEDDGYSE
jgi:hypothetical protein